MAKVERYYLRASDGSPWQQVTKEDWIKAERAAGFRPKLASTDPEYMTTCATGGFGVNGGTRGEIRYEDDDRPLPSLPPIHNARNVGELRRLIQGLADDVPLVRSTSDHGYVVTNVQVATALRDRRGEFTEDHGEEITPEATYGKRMTVVVTG